MINIDINKLEKWMLNEICEAFMRQEHNLKLAQLDRDDRQLQVARAWTAAVLEVLYKYSEKDVNKEM